MIQPGNLPVDPGSILGVRAVAWTEVKRRERKSGHLWESRLGRFSRASVHGFVGAADRRESDYLKVLCGGVFEWCPLGERVNSWPLFDSQNCLATYFILFCIWVLRLKSG